MITIALSKGRIYEETRPLLEAAGIVPAEDPDVSRKLILPTGKPGVRVIIKGSACILIRNSSRDGGGNPP